MILSGASMSHCAGDAAFEPSGSEAEPESSEESSEVGSLADEDDSDASEGGSAIDEDEEEGMDWDELEEEAAR